MFPMSKLNHTYVYLTLVKRSEFIKYLQINLNHNPIAYTRSVYLLNCLIKPANNVVR